MRSSEGLNKSVRLSLKLMRSLDESLKRMLNVKGKPRFNVSKSNKSKLDNKN